MEQALDLYRKNYRPSEINPKPIATIRVWALAADTEEEALRQFKTRKRAIIDRRQSRDVDCRVTPQGDCRFLGTGREGEFNSIKG